MNESHGNEGSRLRYEDKLKKQYKHANLDINSIPQGAIQMDAILEDHFRDEIKKRGISIDENDLSKIMYYSTVGASNVGGKRFTGEQISKVETIDANIKPDFPHSHDGERPLLVHQRTVGQSEGHIFSDAETAEFMRRFPLELGEAFRAAQEMTREDIRKLEEDMVHTNAKRTIDEL